MAAGTAPARTLTLTRLLPLLALLAGALAVLAAGAGRGAAQEPPPLTVAKIIPGDPADTTRFGVVAVPCEGGNRVADAFGQGAPADLDLQPGCWVVSEVPNRSYTFLGWSRGTLDAGSGEAVCPGEPENPDQGFAEVTLDGGEPAVICFYNEAIVRATPTPIDPDDPVDPGKGARLTIAKVIPGYPADTMPFNAVVEPCPDSPPDERRVVSVRQSSPVSLGLPAGCWQVSEDPTSPGYAFAGWALGTDWNGVSCPAEPASDSAPAQVTLRDGEVAVLCLYNVRTLPPPLTIAKVIPGYPDDRTNFSATIIPCDTPGGPVGPPGFAPFAQGMPYYGDLAPGCYQIAEEILPSTPYALVGWAFGGYKDDLLVCPEKPEFGEQPVRVELRGDHMPPVVVCFFNERRDDPGGDPGDGPQRPTLAIAKTVIGQPGDAAAFTAEVALQGSGSPLAAVPFSQSAPGELVLAPGTYVVRELPRAGYVTLGYSFGSSSRGGAVCPGTPEQQGNTVEVTIAPTGQSGEWSPGTGEQVVVCFYNEPAAAQDDPVESGDPPPAVAIRVEKVENVIGFERPGPGWEFTLTGCGVTPRSLVTGPEGVALFAGLPPAVGCAYTVTETVRAGWTPQYISQQAWPRTAGETVTLRFLNIRDWSPPCLAGCFEPPPGEPAAPTAPVPDPPAPQATVQPPAPVEQPTAAPSPEPGGAGTGTDLPTPSAGLATPLPPSTGSGAPAAGLPAPLAAAAIAALSTAAGLAVVAAARRT